LQEFLARGGWDALREIIMGGTGGNTLSYTLGSMDNLMELQNRGWEGLDQAFVARIVEIIGESRDDAELSMMY
jgi:engulfment/cell motility protein 1